MHNALRIAVSLFCALVQGLSQEIVGSPWTGPEGISETTADIMAREAAQGAILSSTSQRLTNRWRGRFPNRSSLPQNPASPLAAASPSPAAASTSAATNSAQKQTIGQYAPQTTVLSFTAATITDTGYSFPPDTMGAAGPSQFAIALNGRIRSFDKATGALGTLNADLDVFFALVRGSDFTVDPRIRFDRLSGRWFVTCNTDAAVSNKVLLAVSSGGTIDASTLWSYYSFQIDTVSPAGDTGYSADYDTLGIDANALYVGVSIFDYFGNFVGATAFVIRKSSVLAGGPIVVTAFRNLTGGLPNGTGPSTPQGVDNYDPAATEGYFIGTDNASFGRLILRRVSNPGGTPSISSNISITVSATANPIPVPHLGNNAPVNGRLDPIDDRLMAAHLRNGHLWTSHAIGVNNTGTSTGTITRNGARWYDLTNLSGTPTVAQYGTVFTPNSVNVTTDRHYWIPTIVVSGQGRAAMGFSTAGTNAFINAATVGRLATDPLGTMQTPVLFTNSTTAYNPPGDDGLPNGVRRWGDYSMTTVDPSDDMTMWTVQEFCNATNSYGVRVVKLLAPPPARPSACNPPTLPIGTTRVNVVVTGTSTLGSGFFDPGAGFTRRLTPSVSGTGVTVNSVSYTDPRHITLNLTVSASAAFGARTITVTNPDSQTATSTTGILILDLPANDAYLSNVLPGSAALTPLFSSTTTSYTTVAPQAAISISLTPLASDPSATIQVNGTTVASGTASWAIPLVPGSASITTITILVTARDGTTTRTYLLSVVRKNNLDFNTDGSSDLLFQYSTGQVAMWFLDGTGNAVNFGTGSGLKPGSKTIYNASLGDWRVAGSGDANGDGFADLLFQNNTGQIAAWFLDGSGSVLDFTTGAGLLPGSKLLYATGLADWKLVEIGDLNGDGIDDLIFQNTIGQIGVWFLDGSGNAANFATGAGLKPGSKMIYSAGLGDWKVVGIGDLNGDGFADLVFQNTAGQIADWLLDGSGNTVDFGTGAGLKPGSKIIYPGSLGDWRIVAIGDFNSDGFADLVFQNVIGQIATWFLDGTGNALDFAAGTGLKPGSKIICASPLGGWKVR